MWHWVEVIFLTLLLNSPQPGSRHSLFKASFPTSAPKHQAGILKTIFKNLSFGCQKRSKFIFNVADLVWKYTGTSFCGHAVCVWMVPELAPSLCRVNYQQLLWSNKLAVNRLRCDTSLEWMDKPDRCHTMYHCCPSAGRLSACRMLKGMLWSSTKGKPQILLLFLEAKHSHFLHQALVALWGSKNNITKCHQWLLFFTHIPLITGITDCLQWF